MKQIIFLSCYLMVLLDGLYPNGHVMEHCLKNKWQFMIVLKEGSLSSVWKEFEALKELEDCNKIKMKWGNRRQVFQWVNNIEYTYDSNDKKSIILHVVVWEETWFVIIAQYFECLIKKVKQLGLRGFIHFIRETIASPWLEYEMMIKRLNRNFQLRLA